MSITVLDKSHPLMTGMDAFPPQRPSSPTHMSGLWSMKSPAELAANLRISGDTSSAAELGVELWMRVRSRLETEGELIPLSEFLALVEDEQDS